MSFQVGSVLVVHRGVLKDFTQSKTKNSVCRWGKNGFNICRASQSFRACIVGVSSAHVSS